MTSGTANPGDSSPPRQPNRVLAARRILGHIIYNRKPDPLQQRAILIRIEAPVIQRLALKLPQH
jgi:hypothetical protein